MSAADLVARLAKEGIDPSLLAEVAQELFGAEVERKILAERRKNERERKADQRAVSRDVTGQGGTSGDKPSPLNAPPKKAPDPKNTPPLISPQPTDDGARAKSHFLPPPGVERDQWKAFRQQRKKPINERSYTLLCNKLRNLAEAGYPPGEMIDLAIERGWETVFEPKDQGNGKANRGSNGRMGGPRPDPTLALVRAATAAQREDSRDHGQARAALPSG